jgi:hypothetical protein
VSSSLVGGVNGPTHGTPGTYQDTLVAADSGRNIGVIARGAALTAVIDNISILKM